MANVCPKCNGRGWYPHTDFLAAKTTRIPCMDCKTTGMIEERQANGIRCGRSESITYFWQFLQFYKPVSTLEIRVKPILNTMGLPTYKDNPFSKTRRIPRMYVEIVRMNTKQEWIGKGIMTCLLFHALADPKLEWAETSLEDSTLEGITFLKKRGFKEEGAKLIWEKDYGKIKGHDGKDYRPEPVNGSDNAGGVGGIPDIARDKQQGNGDVQCKDADGVGKVIPFRHTKREKGVGELPPGAGTVTEPKKDTDSGDKSGNELH